MAWWKLADLERHRNLNKGVEPPSKALAYICKIYDVVDSPPYNFDFWGQYYENRNEMKWTRRTYSARDGGKLRLCIISIGKPTDPKQIIKVLANRKIERRETWKRCKRVKGWFFYRARRRGSNDTTQTRRRNREAEEMATVDDYRVYTIKRFGKVRTIYEPNPELKEKQQQVLTYLSQRGIGATKYAHGFVKGRGIKTAVKPHLRKAVIVHLDIKDFFPTIRDVWISEALEREGVPHGTIQSIVEIACLDHHLPIGSPCSPFLSNVVFKIIDWKLAKFCVNWAQKHGKSFTKIFYSRYADNLIFSSNCHTINRIIPGVKKLLSVHGYTVNEAKTRVMRRTGSQRLLGVIVNEKPNVPRAYWRKLRAQIHQMKCRVHNGEVIDWKDYMNAMGKASFVLSINYVRGKLFMQELKDIRKWGELRQLGQLGLFHPLNKPQADEPSASESNNTDKT